MIKITNENWLSLTVEYLTILQLHLEIAGTTEERK